MRAFALTKWRQDYKGKPWKIHGGMRLLKEKTMNQSSCCTSKDHKNLPRSTQFVEDLKSPNQQVNDRQVPYEQVCAPAMKLTLLCKYNDRQDIENDDD